MRLLLLLLLATAVSARVFDSLSAIPKGWTEVREAEPTDTVTLKIALKKQHVAALKQAVLDMSTPGHAKYGQHMSRDQVRSYVAPSKRSTDAVAEWLASYGIEPSVDNDWFTFSTAVSTANEMLGAAFSWYDYEEGGGSKLRTLSYSVPDSVASHVNMIQPTTRFGQLGAKRSAIFNMTVVDEGDFRIQQLKAGASSAAACEFVVTPDCLRSQYNIGYTPSTEGNLVAFASYLNEYARYADLATFEAKHVPDAVGQNFSVELISGGLNNQSATSSSSEANLDLQYVLGISHPIPVLEYSTGGLGPLVPTMDQEGPISTNEPYLEFLTYILALNDSALPQTLTTSYGEEEQSVPEEYALEICDMFMQLGARGVSVLFSSGDSGLGKSCVSNVDESTTFQPTFPAGCPYVTAVGATTGSAPEAGEGYSSGGFSIYHPRPAWQEEAVSAYLDSIGDTYAAFFNATGRGIPDVAAQGSMFMVRDKGQPSFMSGTSASAPVFAGAVALLNAARKSQGVPPLGFLNPWLYNNTAALLDITSGFSSGCKRAPELGAEGARWNCTAGWDPVTGLGTPKFAELLEAAAPGVANV